MAISTVRIVTMLLVLLAVFVGFLFLERFLARQESKIPGLILPGLQIIGSLIPVFYIANTGDAAEIAWSISWVLLLSNIPTALYLAIYFTCRSKRDKDAERQRMNIQDLD